MNRNASIRRLAAAFLLTLPLAAWAQPASLVRDLNTTPSDPFSPADVTYGGLAASHSYLFFTAATAETGRELWTSDGTSTGTDLLRDLCPGSCSGIGFRRTVGQLHFFAQRLENGTQRLWRTDGTKGGTSQLTFTDLHFDDEFGAPPLVGDRLGILYFSACTGDGAARDCDLWRSDGTQNGTYPFQKGPKSFVWIQSVPNRVVYYLASSGTTWDLWVSDGSDPGTKLLRSFDGQKRPPSAPIVAGLRLFFVAPGDGEELWTSDGTAAGTLALTQLAPAAPFPAKPWLKGAEGSVYFTADDGSHGRELWRSNGTKAGTVRLTDFAASAPFADATPSFLGALGTTSVFWASPDGTAPRLYVNRGTLASTAPLPLACADCGPARDADFVEVGGRAYFLAGRPFNGTDLWATDGTAAGTLRLSGRCSQGDCLFTDLQPWRGGLAFRIEAGFNHDEGWFSDGTSAGTRRLLPLAGSAVDLTGFRLADVGSSTYFLATVDGAAGLWAREANGRLRLAAAVPAPSPSSNPLLLGEVADQLLFTAQDGPAHDPTTWRSGGDAATTRVIASAGAALNPAAGTVTVGGLLYFQTRDFAADVNNLWRTDGTDAGTFVVAHLQSQAPMAAYQGRLMFFDGGWIWQTDGTVAGTGKTGDIPAGLVAIDVVATGPNGVYIKGTSAPGSGEVWFSDGTSAGTRELTSFNQNGASGYPPNFTTVGSQVYFAWIDGLWRTNGSRGGTERVQSLPSFELPVALAELHGSLVYLTAAAESVVGVHLWRTQGTEATTVRLGSYPGQDVFTAFPVRFVPLGGKLYFNLDDGVHGKELMATDGSPAGTGVVADLVPGAGGSAVSDLTLAAGRLYFAAGEPKHGRELWSSDGTAEGTRLVQDLAPQALSSTPRQLLVAGDKLFFAADDGVTGRELWVLPLDGSGACQPSSTRLCLNGGRYAVEAVWRTAAGASGVGHTLPLAADTGAFWFFDAENVEAVIKVLDGSPVNDHVWVFYGALSNVEYSLTVTDTQSGLSHRYTNPQGQLASVADTQSFGPRGANATVGSLVSKSGGAKAAAPLVLVDRRVVARAATGACAPSSERLCLNGGRYAVEVAWKDFQGNAGTGKGTGLTPDTGYFWFFDPANVELVLKILDGSAVNGHRWVFYGALSSVEYTVTVTDTQTGEIKTYRNASGHLASVADTEAF